MAPANSHCSFLAIISEIHPKKLITHTQEKKKATTQTLTTCNRPRSGATDIVIVGILLALVRTGAKAKCLLCTESHVWMAFSYSTLQFRRKTILDISEAESAVSREAHNTALICMTIHREMWGNGCTHYLLTQLWANFKGLVKGC